MNNPNYAWNRKRLAVFLFIVLAAVAAVGFATLTLAALADAWEAFNTSTGSNL